MNRHERTLVLILRVIAILELLAIPAIVMPFSWMATVHEALGLGELPASSIVSYLARSLSAFYAMHGAFTFFLSFDVKRYGQLVAVWGYSTLILGIALFGVDLSIRMPVWWTVLEGPFAITFGGTVVWLHHQSNRSGIE